MARWWLFIGSIAGLLGVAGGAFGAHALKARVSAQMLANFETGTSTCWCMLWHFWSSVSSPAGPAQPA